VTFRWRCGIGDFKVMGATWRPSIGDPREAAAKIKEGKGPLIPRWVYNYVDSQEDLHILDFGAGAGAVQVAALRELGYKIDGYEWPPEPGDNSKRSKQYYASVEAGLLNPKALDQGWDMILASNVMNVQRSWGCFHVTMEDLKDLLDGRPHAEFVTNLASEPRVIWDKARAEGYDELESLLVYHFEVVERHDVPGSKEEVFVCQDPVFYTAQEEKKIVETPWPKRAMVEIEED
jgi:hypothetical protein